MPKAKRSGATQRVSVDLANLALHGGGGWSPEGPSVRAADRAAAIQQLRDAGLSEDVVQALEQRLAGAHRRHVAAEGEPTVGENRKVLVAAADLAQALATILGSASASADAEFDAALGGRLGDRRRLGDDLQRFADALALRIEAMPTQGRRRPLVALVWALDEVAGPYLPAPTTWQESPYYRACCAAFVLAGHPVTPDKAILRYVKLKGT